MSQTVPDCPTELTAQQTQAAVLWAFHGRQSAAKLAKVSVRTMNRWREIPAFVQLFAHTAQQAGEFAQGEMRAMLSKAMETLHNLLDDEDPAVRLGAVKTLLDNVNKADESGELKRLLALLGKPG